MNICLVNGSPKYQESTSGLILSVLERELGPEHRYTRFLTSAGNVDEWLAVLDGCDIMILTFPLYVDGIPAHLLRLLVDLESKIVGAVNKVTLYVVINNGFFEARQNGTALAMIRIFCEKVGFRWGLGIGIGGGGMLSGTPLESRLIRNIRNALMVLAGNVRTNSTAEDRLAEPNIPRRLYILAAHIGWRKLAKQNGVKL